MTEPIAKVYNMVFVAPVEWLFNHLIPKCSIGEVGVW